MTFLNETDHLLKIYWYVTFAFIVLLNSSRQYELDLQYTQIILCRNNYDADKEFFAKVAPAGHYTVDTWAVRPT